MKLSLQIVSILTVWSQNVGACIWQDGDQPFWPSNEIAVCFLPQEQHLTSDPLLVRAYNDARSNIQRTLHQQINVRNTGFKFNGFKTCDYDYRTQGPRDDLPPMIRIELTSDGRQEQSALTNGLIGPASGTKSVNTHLSYASQRLDKKTKTRTWKSNVGSTDFQQVTLHEILHILGIHHPYYWDSPEELEKATQGRYVKLGDTMDKRSMTCGVQGCDSSNGPVLSDRDISCLQQISSKRIKSSAVVGGRNIPPVRGAR